MRSYLAVFHLLGTFKNTRASYSIRVYVGSSLQQLVVLMLAFCFLIDQEHIGVILLAKM